MNIRHLGWSILIIFILALNISAYSQDMMISGYDTYGDSNGISGSVWIRGQFDFADPDRVLREHGQAIFYARWPGEGWFQVGSNPASSSIYIKGMTYNIRGIGITINASGFELKACMRDGSRCSNPTFIDLAPVYMGKPYDQITRSTLNTDNGLQICMNGPIKLPVTMYLSITEGSMPARSDRIINLSNVNCSGSCCSGIIPNQARTTEEVWDVGISTALGKARNLPRFQFVKPEIVRPPRPFPVPVPPRM